MTTPDDSDLTAAELALGVLEGEERAAALRRILADPAFARDVDRWRRHFAALYAEVPAVEPRLEMESRIAAAVLGNRRRPGSWRIVVAAASVAAAILLAVVLVRPSPEPPARPIAVQPRPLLVAVLKPKDGGPIAAVFDPLTRTIRLRGDLDVPRDREAELWAIGADGVPHAAGMLTASTIGPVFVAPHIGISAGVTLAVSFERQGGSAKSTPTGPVVATGTFAAI